MTNKLPRWVYVSNIKNNDNYWDKRLLITERPKECSIRYICVGKWQEYNFICWGSFDVEYWQYLKEIPNEELTDKERELDYKSELPIVDYDSVKIRYKDSEGNDLFAGDEVRVHHNSITEAKMNENVQEFFGMYYWNYLTRTSYTWKYAVKIKKEHVKEKEYIQIQWYKIDVDKAKELLLIKE